MACKGREAHLEKFNVCVKPSAVTCPYDNPHGNKVFCPTDGLCKPTCETCVGMYDLNSANTTCKVKPTKQKYKVKVSVDVLGYTVETFNEDAQDAYRESLAFVMQTSKRYIIILSIIKLQGETV